MSAAEHIIWLDPEPEPLVPVHELTVIGGGPAGLQGLCRCGETFDAVTADEMSDKFRDHERSQLSLF